MKTRLFTLLLAVAASVGMMHAAIIDGTCGENLTWSLNTKDSTLTIEGSGEMTSNPWSEYKSYIAYLILHEGVTSIGNNAFSGCSKLTSVTIPNSVTSIGFYAFNECTGLTKVNIMDIAAWCAISCLNDVSGSGNGNPLYYAHHLYINGTEIKDLVIPDGVTSIGDNAFRGLSGLTSVQIPNSVTSIGAWAFEECGFASLTIPNSVTTIGDGAFFLCKSLTSVTIPNGVTSIQYAVFELCYSLSSITIPNSVTSIGAYAFTACPISQIHYNGSVLEWLEKTWNVNQISSNYTLYLDNELVEDVVIPNSVTNIKSCAFSGCNSLSAVTIPKSITSIGDKAFEGCNLSSVTSKAITPPIISDNTFSNYAATLFIPAVSTETYQNTLYWELFANVQSIPVQNPVVTFLDWNGKILSSEEIQDGTAATPPSNPTREGYTFIGWDKDFSNITEDLVVTAQYKINRYEVIFKDWDGTTLKADSVDYNAAAVAPTNPLREGHEFIGWDKDYSHVKSDMTVTAQYAVNYYPVGFLNYDGTLLSEQSIAYNQAAMEPNVPTREGYTFIGWTADIEHITARTFAIALYEKDGINVTYISEEGDTIVSEKVDMHLPDAPVVSGKTFTGWLTESASNAEGIVFRATYTLDNPTTGEDVVVIPTSSTAGVSFPYITGAMTYMLVIRDLFGTVVCKIMFDADGHLLGIAFAPGRNRTQKAQSEGFHFTVEGLTPGTTYEYEFVAYDEADQVIETLTGSFETTADDTGVNNISSASAPQKVINDGHVFVLRGDKTYTMQGQEVK